MDDVEEIQQLEVQVDYVIKVLQAHYRHEKSYALWQAFAWDEHPYRYPFWNEEAQKLQASKSLSRKAIKELERILVIKTLA